MSEAVELEEIFNTYDKVGEASRDDMLGIAKIVDKVFRMLDVDIDVKVVNVDGQTKVIISDTFGDTECSSAVDVFFVAIDALKDEGATEVDNYLGMYDGVLYSVVVYRIPCMCSDGWNLCDCYVAFLDDQFDKFEVYFKEKVLHSFVWDLLSAMALCCRKMKCSEGR